MVDEKVIAIEKEVADAIWDYFNANNIFYDKKKEDEYITQRLAEATENAEAVEWSWRFDERWLALENYLKKVISVCRRQVVFSDELQEKLGSLPPDIADRVKEFSQRFEHGDDMNSHLSRSIFQSEKLDYLLNLWNVKHLHLGEKAVFEDTAMKDNRSEWLLFCIIKADTVYMLDVRQHPKGSGFTAYSFLEIIERNSWMEQSEMYLLQGIVALENPIRNDDDIYQLVKSGVSTAFEINGKCYTGLGISTKGNLVLQVTQLLNVRKAIRSLIKKYPDTYFCGMELDDSNRRWKLLLDIGVEKLSLIGGYPVE